MGKVTAKTWEIVLSTSAWHTLQNITSTLPNAGSGFPNYIPILHSSLPKYTIFKRSKVTQLKQKISPLSSYLCHARDYRNDIELGGVLMFARNILRLSELLLQVLPLLLQELPIRCRPRIAATSAKLVVALE